MFRFLFCSTWLVLFFVTLAGCQRTTADPKTRELNLSPVNKNGSNVESNRGWPNLFGPDRQSRVTDSQLPPKISEVPKELWRIEIGSGYSAPLVQDNRLFVVHRQEDQEIIECFSATSGDSLWSYSFPATYECPYEYSDGPYSTPVLFDNRMIVVGLAGNTVCLEQSNGKVLWNRDLFADYGMEPGEWPVAASGIVIENRFVFNLGAHQKDAGVIALDVDSGRTLWQCTSHEAGHATPNLMEVDGQKHVIMVTSNGLISIDPRLGKENWFVPFRRKKAETYNAVSPVVFRNIVCMVTGPGPGTLVVEVESSNRPKIKWQNRRILDSQYTNLLCVDGFLIGFTPMKQGGPELRCIDLLQQKLTWAWKARLGRGMILALNETILILGEKGNLAGASLRPDKIEPLFRTESPVLKAPCYSAPAYFDGKLYLRNEHHVVCLRLQNSISK